MIAGSIIGQLGSILQHPETLIEALGVAIPQVWGGGRVGGGGEAPARGTGWGHARKRETVEVSLV